MGYIGFTHGVKLTVLPSFTQFYPTGFTHWVKPTCQPWLQHNEIALKEESKLPQSIIFGHCVKILRALIFLNFD